MSRRHLSVLSAFAGWLLVFGLPAFFLAGCATGRDYQADIDAMNSKIAALQGQLTAKDQEISGLQNQMRDEEAARVQAENEKRALAEKLDGALAKMDSMSQKKKVSSAASDSDLK